MDAWPYSTVYSSKRTANSHNARVQGGETLIARSHARVCLCDRPVLRPVFAHFIFTYRLASVTDKYEIAHFIITTTHVTFFYRAYLSPYVSCGGWAPGRSRYSMRRRVIFRARRAGRVAGQFSGKHGHYSTLPRSIVRPPDDGVRDTWCV